MKKLFCLVAASVFMTGCASQAMRGYVGKDVREVMLDYGPPVNAFDMGDGRRAFQWVVGTSYTTPVTATTTGMVSEFGSTSWVNSNTTISGGETVVSECIYTLFGRWNEAAQGWLVTEFRKPKLGCE